MYNGTMLGILKQAKPSDVKEVFRDCFIAYAHYDGVREIWPYPKSDKQNALKRFARLRDRPTLILANGKADSSFIRIFFQVLLKTIYF